jgi:hypothetical protein
VRLRRPRLWIIVLTGAIALAVIGGGLGSFWLGPAEPITLQSLTPATQERFFLQFLKPRPVDFALTSEADAVKLAEHADREALPVREVVLARVHGVDRGLLGDPLCWVVVMTFNQTPPAGPPFVIVLVDAHTDQVILQGGEFAQR